MPGNLEILCFLTIARLWSCFIVHCVLVSTFWYKPFLGFWRLLLTKDRLDLHYVSLWITISEKSKKFISSFTSGKCRNKRHIRILPKWCAPPFMINEGNSAVTFVKTPPPDLYINMYIPSKPIKQTKLLQTNKVTMDQDLRGEKNV